MTKLSDKEAAKKHLLDYGGKNSCWAFYGPSTETKYNFSTRKYETKSGVQLTTKYNQICYAGLNGFSTMEFLGVGYFSPKNNKAGIKFLEWITGPESPWRSLWGEDRFEIVEDPTYIRGFFLPVSMLKQKEKFIKNFLIASRNFNEFREHINFWYECVKEGVDPARAYLYCHLFQKYDGEKQIRQRIVPNANHWPLCSNTSLDRLKKSNLREKSQYNNTVLADSDGENWDIDRPWLDEIKISAKSIKDNIETIDKAAKEYYK